MFMREERLWISQRWVWFAIFAAEFKRDQGVRSTVPSANLPDAVAIIDVFDD